MTEHVGILTTDHLLATAPASLRALVPDSVPESCLQHLTELSLAAVAPAIVPCKDPLSGLGTVWQGFGLEGLDDLIPDQGYGGWHGSGMMELSGTKSSGKTVRKRDDVQSLPRSSCSRYISHSDISSRKSLLAVTGLMWTGASRLLERGRFWKHGK